MKLRYRIFACLFALLFLCGAFASCRNKPGELEKGTIIEQPAASDSAWQPLTAARTELDATYRQKLEATQEFAPLPEDFNGTKYYISSIRGNDSNSGTSPDKAWKSPAKANDAAIKSGDAVLFECGSVFRRTKNDYFFKTKSGVIYSSYGEGEKPIFYGSIKVPASQWTAVPGKENLYYYDGGKEFDLTIQHDIGNIVFNNGEAWGIKIQMTYNDPETKSSPANKTLALQDVSNGLRTYASIPSYRLKSGEDLRTYDLSFYHDYKNRKVYLKYWNLSFFLESGKILMFLHRIGI